MRADQQPCRPLQARLTFRNPSSTKTDLRTWSTTSYGFRRTCTVEPLSSTDWVSGFFNLVMKEQFNEAISIYSRKSAPVPRDRCLQRCHSHLASCGSQILLLEQHSYRFCASASARLETEGLQWQTLLPCIHHRS